MARPDALEAHAPIHPRWQRPVPGYTPTTEGAPNLPNKPRLPHVPHFKHAGRIATFAMAGAVALTTAEGFIRPHGTSDPSGARAGEVPAEQMRYPWDAGKVNLELIFTEPEPGISEFSGVEITSDPQVIQKDKDTFIVYVLGAKYGSLDNPMGHVRIDMIGDSLEGGVWEKEVDQDGNNVLNPDGGPVLHKYGYQEPEPGQEGLA